MDANKEVKMQRQMSIIDGVGLIVGIMIGSGIFVSPTGVLRFSGSVGLSLTVWLMIGISTTIGAICFSELGTMIPKSGGKYPYILEAFGELPAFLYLWMSMMVMTPTANAVMALTFANYLLQPLFLNCDAPPDTSVRLLAGVVICFITWLNCHNIKVATRVQDVLTLIKVVSLIIIIVTGGYFMTQGHLQNYQRPFLGSHWSATSIATAFYQGSFSFSGWYVLNFVVEELKNPIRDLPRSICISIPLVTLLYLLTNAAYFVILSPGEMLSSSAVAVTFVSKVFGKVTWVMSVLVAISIFGSIHGSLFASSRIYFSGAREGQLPETLGLINIDSLLPVPSLIITGALSVLMLVSSDIVSLINYLSFSDTLFVLITIVALLWLRYKRPEMHRPLKVWLGFPIMYFFICLFLVILPVIERPIELGVAIAILSAGVPVYFGCSKWAKTNEKCSNYIGKCTRLVQLLTVSAPQD